MINKIVFFVESPFNKRNYERFGIELLIKNGFEVEVWEFTPFLHPLVHREMEITDPVIFPGLRRFMDKKDAIAAIATLNNNCFVNCFAGWQNSSIDIYKAISKNNLKYSVPMSNVAPPFKARSKSLLNPLRMAKRFLSYARRAIAMRQIKPVDIILAGGQKSLHHSYPIGPNTEKLWVHNMDYDLFIKEANNPVDVDNNMGVFLDESLPLYGDYLYFGTSSPIDPEEYYALLRKYFNYLEMNFGVHIVVAAHPVSYYERHPHFFGGRQVIKGKTMELVRKAGFVISHSSTSVCFAVMFKKPIMYITSKKIQGGNAGPMIEKFASLFNKKLIYLDEPLSIDWADEMKIDDQLYERYKNDYIKKKGSEESPYWQIFANRIKQY